MEPLVSVIIPVYNVLPYLREALDSVINQTYKNLEILVVDDGSTDGSGEVCDEYLSDPRVIVIHQENKGLSGARNTALDRMTGEYVAFLDSDDAFLPEMIEKMLGVILRNKADMIICEYVMCKTKKNMDIKNSKRPFSLQIDKESSFTSTDALNMIINGNVCWCVWNKLYNRSVWDGIHFPQGNNYEDMQIMCKILEKCQHIIIIPDACVLHRQRLASITASCTEKNLLDYVWALKTIEKYIELHHTTIFFPENVLFFQERYARDLSCRYAKLLFSPHSPERMRKIKKEIDAWWKPLEEKPCKLFSKMTHFLFIHAPWFIIPSRACWAFGKHLTVKANRS